MVEGSAALWRILGELEHFKPSGSGYEARCPGPAHRNADRHASLSIGLGDDGRVLLKCHAGCSTQDILAALGLDWSDLFEHNAQGHLIRRFKLRRNGHVVAEHVREDLPGDDKKVWWESHGKNGLGDAKVVDLPLYGADRLAGVPLSTPVILTEGEPAAQALLDIGVLAVGTVCGAGTIPSAQALEPLQGRPIWPWADNDDAGRTHMQGTAARISPLPPAWIIWPDAPPGGDAADYVAAGGTAEGIARLLVVQTDDSEPYSAATLVDLELAEPRYAVPAVLPEGVALLAGKSKLGKSWLAMDAALAVATGGKAWGAIQVEQGEVLYLALEDSKRRLQERLYALRGRDIPADLYLHTDWQRADEGGLERIMDWLARHPRARLVVIDVLARFRPREANMRRLYDLDYDALAPLAKVARVRGICVLVLHHANKLNPEDPVDSISGTTGLAGAADAIVIFRRERGKADASLLVTGRDIEEQELACNFVLNEHSGLAWRVIGKADEFRWSRERQAVIDVLLALPGLRPVEIAGALGKTPGSVRYLLFQMVRAHQVRTRDGKYFAPNSTNSANDTNATAAPAPLSIYPHNANTQSQKLLGALAQAPLPTPVSDSDVAPVGALGSRVRVREGSEEYEQWLARQDLPWDAPEEPSRAEARDRRRELRSRVCRWCAEPMPHDPNEVCRFPEDLP